MSDLDGAGDQTVVDDVAGMEVPVVAYDFALHGLEVSEVRTQVIDRPMLQHAA